MHDWVGDWVVQPCTKCLLSQVQWYTSLPYVCKLAIQSLYVQLKDETERCEEDEAEKRVQLKAMREHHHKWEDTREGRVGTWRDFVKGKKTRVSLLLCLGVIC